MRNVYPCLVLSLLLLSTTALSNDRDVPWLVSWPFFQNAQTPHSIQSGYGDWCIIDEGAHPGLDFAALADDSVVVPTDQVMVSLGAKDFGAASGGCAMAIAPSVEGDTPADRHERY